MGFLLSLEIKNNYWQIAVTIGSTVVLSVSNVFLHVVNRFPITFSPRCVLLFLWIHVYIIGHYKPWFGLQPGPISTLLLCVLLSVHELWDLQVKIDSERQTLYQESTKRKHTKLHIFFFLLVEDAWRGFQPGPYVL